MRDRLVVAFALLTVIVLVAFTMSRAYSVGSLVTQTETRKVERSVTLLAELIGEREANHEPVTTGYLRALLNVAERVEYRSPSGRELGAQSPDYVANPNEEDIVRRAAVPGGGQVTMRRSGELVEQRISDHLLPLVVLGIVLTLVACALGYLAARLLSRPFRELADSARALGRGRFDLQVPRYSIPEADTIGRALEQSAAQLHDLVRREREFAANVSHQLRTPITALRLEIEDLTLWRETPRPVVDQLNRSLRELDRLSNTVSDLLELARGRRVGVGADVDVAELAREAVRRWQPLAAAAERGVTLLPAPAACVHLAPGPVEQILDVLVENAIRHGAGAITLDVVEAADHVRLRVRDEGVAVLDEQIFERHVNRRGSDGMGIGLAVATEVADALGGRLTLDGGPVTSFTLVLPRT
jgi:signal transduction histidine kinase